MTLFRRSIALLLVAFALLPHSVQAQQPEKVPSDSVAESPAVDSLRAAFDRFEAASPPTAADSALLRRWADSLKATARTRLEQDPRTARGSFRAVRDVYQALSDSVEVGNATKWLGITYAIQDRFQEAARHFQTALRSARRAGSERKVASNLINVGIVHYKQGRYNRALSTYQKALRIDRRLENRRGVLRDLTNIAIVYREQGRFDRALKTYREALQLSRELDNRSGIATNLNNMAGLYREQGKDEKALEAYQEAIRISREIGMDRVVAESQNNIGVLHEKHARYEDALRQFREALRINRQIGNRIDTAYNLRNIGEVNLREGHLQAAVDTLRRSVRLAESLRLNATSPEARRSLLSTQIDVYHVLATAYVRAEHPDSAFHAVEQARARLLTDRLAGTATGDTTFTVPSTDALRRTLDPDEAVLLYANVGTDWPLAALVVTGDRTLARELPDSTVRAEIEDAYSARLNRLRKEENLLTETAGPDASVSGTDDDPLPSLAGVIRLYRYYLARGNAETSVQKDLSGRLRELLIDPVSESLSNAESVTVVPTGALGYLPFETLQDAAGAYLIEETGVRYAQSLTVRRQLQQRDYAEREQPLLAVGGAAYETNLETEGGSLVAEVRGGSTRVATENHASTLLRSTETQMEQGQSPRETYARLGYRQWANLPGTGEEVEQIGSLFGPSATVITGPEASEDTMRAMSGRDALADYRYLHFATHGVAVPETPKLSALVLSQVGASDSLAARDGYLTMEEIAGLEMEADVAVLSACQTGLGKVVAGEGVVSLSHAFLRAGANATLVSQWKVLDESTRQFMTGVYERASDEGTSFAEAVTETKRAFIDGEYGEKNTDPLRWAPFVYYGRE